LAQYAIDNPQQPTPERHTVSYEIIRRAAQLWREGVTSNLGAGEREKFLSAMQREGQAHMLSDEQDNLARWPPETGNSGAAPVIAFAEPPGAVMPSPVSSPSLPSKVFVVHGHDGEMRETVARFIEKVGLAGIILHERPNKGRTIIEKFEANGDVGFVVVLLTPDDEGGKIGGAAQKRARQNVILEWGYFIGRLGRSRVCALKKGDVELPSDILGIVRETFDEHGAWKHKLAKELEEGWLRDRLVPGGATMIQLVPVVVSSNAPALVAAAGERAQTRFWEFFVSNIRNPHRRRAYVRAAQEFLAWCEQHGLGSIIDVQPLHVGAYVKVMTRRYAAWPLRCHQLRRIVLVHSYWL
jgi:Predicted nucleotide-binding protein containing TIR-like domain